MMWQTFLSQSKSRWDNLAVSMYVWQEGSVPTLAYQMGVRNLEMRTEIRAREGLSG